MKPIYILCAVLLSIGTSCKNKPTKLSPTEMQDIGLGPELINESNFYFSGMFQANSTDTTLYDCATGESFKISQKGDLKTIIERYKTATPSGKAVYGKFRGYLLPMDESPRLVLTYVDDWEMDDTCNEDENLTTGVWRFSIQDENYSLQLNKDYTFNFKYTSKQDTISRNGSWGLLTEDQLALFYTQPCRYLSHTINIEEHPTTLNYVDERSYSVLMRR